MEVRENVISILVNNKPDVLARISGTLSGRGFNIESISANVTMDPARTRIIITTIGDNATLTRILKQIARLVDIIDVADLTGRKAVRRELFLVRLNWSKEGERKKIEALAKEKNWKILSADEHRCVLEITGENGVLLKEIMALKQFGMEDFTRTGVVAIEYGL
ncbi:MAG: acetolactate synthase small subunit [Syntrophales bacterium]|jgi:acetolactate synthase-1/3 small subunit|nr:acetolactate synthase small subunit [Syntrophales bacterium]